MFRRALDPLVVLAAAAATTSRVRLGTNVLAAPWYPPALLARTATSIDRISGGRLLLGLGVGWCPEEFAAVRMPLSERGDRLDECLDVLEAWWKDEPAIVVNNAGVADFTPFEQITEELFTFVYRSTFSDRSS